MKYLLDTNILLRLIELNHPQHKQASEALKKLKNQNAEFYILLQNISEFWNVCTRLKVKNGLGLSIAETDLHLKRFKRFLNFFPTQPMSIKTGANSSSNIPFPAFNSMTQKSPTR